MRPGVVPRVEGRVRLALPELIAAFAVTAVFATTAAAQVSVQAPLSTESVIPYVNSSVYLQASSTSCAGSPTVSMGYSIDSSQQLYAWNGAQALQLMTAAGALTAGQHTINIKAWNSNPSDPACVATETVNVVSSTSDAVQINGPYEGDTVYPGFTLSASASSCNGEPVGTMGYAFDSNSVTEVSGDSMSVNPSESGLSAGWHLLRAKAWGGSYYCETDVQVNVPPSGGITPPLTATQLPQLEQNPQYTGSYGSCPSSGADGPGSPYFYLWQSQNDCNAGTGSGNTGSSQWAYSTTHGGEWEDQQYNMTYGGDGNGIRWFDAQPGDDGATHFLYDAWVYFPALTNVMNIEMDMNHSIGSTGQLYILAVQCNLQSSTTGYWDVTVNGAWKQTTSQCTPSTFSPGAWHHVQILTQHDAEPGTGIQYEEVAVDGAVESLQQCPGNTTCTSTSSTPGWPSFIGPNFQLDGGGYGEGDQNGGSITAYISTFTIFYW